MRMAVFPTLLLLGLSSCTPSQSSLPTQMRQDTLDEVYPPDCFRIDILEARGQPHGTGRVEEKTPTGYVAGAIRRIEKETGAVVARWDSYLTLRGGLGSSFGAFGLYEDFLFYTKDDVLIRARRRFLD